MLEDRLHPALTFTAQPLSVFTGQTMPVVRVHSDAGANVPITLALHQESTDGTPILGGTVTQQTDGSGIATFNNLFVYGGTAKNAHFTASAAPSAATTLDPVQSNVFQVKAGGSQLYVSSTIPTTVAGESLGTIEVHALDVSGSINFSDGTTQVQLFIHNSPGDPAQVHFLNAATDAVITTAITATMVNGIATFENLALDKAGIGYTLGVEAINNSVLVPATSNAFVVTAAAPTKLAFQTQPTYTGADTLSIGNTDTINVYSTPDGSGNGGSVNTWPGIVVQVVDKFNNQVTSGFSGGSVTITAADSANNPVMFTRNTPQGPQNFPAATKNIDAGTAVATFDEKVTGEFDLTKFPLKIFTQGNDYTLNAAGTIIVGGNIVTLTPVTSDQFNVGAKRTQLKFVTANPFNQDYQQRVQMPLIQVAVADASGNVITADNSTVVYLDGGDFLGTKARTVVNGVATFDDIMIQGRKLPDTNPPKLQIDLNFRCLDLSEPTTLNGKINVVSGPAYSLKFASAGLQDVGTGSTVTAGKHIKGPDGQPLKVMVVDQDNNLIVSDNTTVVSIGLLPNEGRGPIFVGNGPEPTSGNPVREIALNTGVLPPAGYTFDFRATVKVVNGIASFDNLYTNFVGSNFILSAGTSDFAVHSGTDTKGFRVVAGQATQLVFGRQPDTSNNETSFTFKGLGPGVADPLPGVNGVVIRALDQFGNLATGFDGPSAQINIELIKIGGTGNLAGQSTITAHQGFAVINQTYIQQNGGTFGETNTYQLKVKSGSLTEATSEQFFLNKRAGSFDNTGDPTVTIETPGNQTSGHSFPVKVQVKNAITNTYPYGDAAKVRLELRDAQGNFLINSPATITYDDKAAPDNNGLIIYTVTISSPSKADFTLAALLDLHAKFVTTDSFNDPPPEDAPTLTTSSSGVFQIGLGSLTTNFDTISSTGVYNSFPPGGRPFPPVVGFDPAVVTATNTLPALQQPVAAAGFNQVPQSTDWWSSLMFPRTKVATTKTNDQVVAKDYVTPQDSTFNQLFALTANPFTAMVNSNGVIQRLGNTVQGSDTITGIDVKDLTVGMLVSGDHIKPGTKIITIDKDNNRLTVTSGGVVDTSTEAVLLGFTDNFAGLGLSYLTDLFVLPSKAFNDPPPPFVPVGQPQAWANPQAPGAERWFYKWDGNGNNRLYQDFSVGLAGVQADGRVLAYSDWTVTLDWVGKLLSGKTEELQATLGQGLPFVYFTVPTATDASHTEIQLVTSPKNSFDTTTQKQAPVPVNIRAYGPSGGNPITSGTGAFELEMEYALQDVLNEIKRTGTLNNSLNTVTVTDVSRLQPGMTVTGTGIAAGATIASIAGNTLTLSPGGVTGTGSQDLKFNTILHHTHFYGIYLPDGVAWSLTTNLDGTKTIKAQLDSKNYFSVATLPGGTTGTFNTAFNDFLPHAYSFVTGSTSSFNINQTTGEVITSYELQTVVKQGADNGPLQALNATQYNNLLPGDKQVLMNFNPGGTKKYVSPHGNLLLYKGAVFHTQLQYTGVLPQVPPLLNNGNPVGGQGGDADLWHTYLQPLLRSVSTKAQSDGRLVLDNLFPDDNNYLQSQSMYGAAQLAPILLEIAQSTDPGLTANDKLQAAGYAEDVYNQVKNRMVAWLDGAGNGAQALQQFYYQPAIPQETSSAQPAPANSPGWQSLMSILSGFLSSETLNDHQLIAGYFIKTAAFLAQYDSTWGGTTQAVGFEHLRGKLGDMVNLIIGDVANYDRNSNIFPFLRNFDVWAMHSWADGASNDNVGTNLESSSEAMNFNSAVILWGQAIGDKALQDLGIYLYTTELEGVNSYWFSRKNKTDPFGNPTQVIPTEYLGSGPTERTIVTKLNSNGGAYVGFIGFQTSRVAGIQFLPFSGSAYYLGQDKDFVFETYNNAITGQTAAGVIPVLPPTYRSLTLPYYALSNASDALTQYKQNINGITLVNPLDQIDNHAFNIHWMEVLDQYGTVDSSVKAFTKAADGTRSYAVSYAVFIKGGTQTFVAYNPSARDQEFIFKLANNTEIPVTVKAHSTGVFDASGAERTNQLKSPDYALKTPQSRFFFTTDTNGNPTLTYGQPGTGRSTVKITDVSHTKFTITGLTGSLQSQDAVAAFQMYFNPMFRATGDAPLVQVKVTYDQFGDGTKKITHIYDTFPMSNNPGYVVYRSQQGGGVVAGSASKGFFHYMVNGSVTVEIEPADNAGRVTQVIIPEGQGGEYTGTPSVTFSAAPSGEGNRNATGTAIMANGKVIGVNITDPGRGYTSAPSVTFSGGGQIKQATGVAVIGKPITSDTPVLLRTDAAAAQGSVSFIDLPYNFTTVSPSSTGVSRVSLTNVGVGYTGVPTVTFSAPPTGVTATGTATIVVSEVQITNEGTSYTPATTTVTFSPAPAGGVTAEGKAVIDVNGHVIAVIITKPGLGYTTMPTVTITGGNNQAAGVAKAKVAGVTITNPGSGYVTAPTVTFSGGGATTQATGVGVISKTVAQLNLGGQIFGQALPDIAGLPLAPLASVTPSSPTHAGWISGVSGSTATMTASGVANEPLVITVDAKAGLLMNNRYSAGNPGFDSAYDFDSSPGIIKTVAAKADSTLNITGGNNDAITLGAPYAPASSLLAHFRVSTGGIGGTGSFTIDDGHRLTTGNYKVAKAGSDIAITTQDAGLNVTLVGSNAFSGGVKLITGKASNFVEVLASRANETLTLSTHSSNGESVAIGDGNVANILGTVVIANDAPGGFSDVFVVNSAAANATNSVTISGTSITGLAPGTIQYSDASIDDLVILGGTNATTYNVTAALGGSIFALFTGATQDKVIVSNNGLVNNASFGGFMALQGGTNSTLQINDSHNALSRTIDVHNIQVGVPGATVSGLTAVPFIVDFKSIDFNLGTASNTLSVDTNQVGPQQKINVWAAGALNLPKVLIEGDLQVTATGAVTVGGGPATAIATKGGNVTIFGATINVTQTIDTTPGSGGTVITGAGVTPTAPNALYVAGAGNIKLNDNASAKTIVVDAGSGQSATVGAAFTTQLKAKVTDASSNPVSGATVTFIAPSSGASGTFANGTIIYVATTDASGIATATTFTANQTAGGPYLVTATTQGATTPANFSLTNTDSTVATKLGFVQGPTTGIFNTVISPNVTVQLLDQFNNPVSTSGVNITLALGNNPGSATLGGTVTQATVNGVATFNNLTVSAGGVGYTLVASSGSLTPATSAAFDQATQLVFVQQPSSTQAGATIAPPITVQVQDQFGNKVKSATFSIGMAIDTNPGGGTLSGTTPSTTDANGLATFSNLSINNQGNGYTLKATTGTLQIVSATFNVTSAATSLAFVQQPTSGIVGAVISPAVTVQVLDAEGDAIGGTFSITIAATGPGNLSGTLTRTTDTNGLATFNDLRLSAPGSYTLSATSTGLTGSGPSSSFDQQAKLVFVQQPTSGTAGQVIQPDIIVQAEDANDQPLVGVSITMAIGSNPGGSTLGGTTVHVTNASGLATFDDLTLNNAGTGYTLQATAAGNSSATSAAFNQSTAATQLAFVQQPTSGSTGHIIAPPITVQVLDAAGHPVAGTFGVSIGFGTNPTGAVLGGTLAVTTNENGLATFDNLTVSKAGDGYTLVVSSGGLTAATSDPFDQTSTFLTFTQQPTSGNAGSVISPAITVTAKDQNGVAISGVSITMTIGANPGSSTLGGTTTQMTNLSGIATFNDLTISNPGLGYTLVATGADPHESTVTSASFNQAGVATNLDFVQQPTTGNAGSIISPAVTVQVEDAQGAAVSGSFSITIALGNNPNGATLSGTLTQPTNAFGLATFNNLTLNQVGTGYTLVVSATGLTGDTSQAFNQLGVPTSLVFTQQPSSGTVGSVISPAVKVNVLDQLGNPLSGVFGITMTIGSNPGGATLGGTTSKDTNSAGQATFDNLTVDQPGVNYTLVATSGSLNVTSSAFTEVPSVTTQLSNTTVREKRPVGTVVGTFSSDPAGSYTYVLASGGDNDSFSIVGNQLQTGQIFDFSVKSQYQITVKTMQGAIEVSSDPFTIDISQANITTQLSNNTIVENLPAGTLVGTFSSSPSGTYTYQLGSGGDNTSFTISGNQLLSAAIFDFEVKSQYQITVSTFEAGIEVAVDQFTIDIEPVAANLAFVASPKNGLPLRGFDATGNELFQLVPFTNYTGNVTVAVGDVNGDLVPDLIVATQVAPARVTVFNGTTLATTPAELISFSAFNGVGGYVAVGDINGDNHADIVVGQSGRGGLVKAYDGADASNGIETQLANIRAYPNGQVRVALADFNGDNTPDLITASVNRAAIKVFDGVSLAAGNKQRLDSFPSFSVGSYVSAGDFNGDNKTDIVVGRQRGSSKIKVYNAADTSQVLLDFLAVPGATVGVRVAVTDLNGDSTPDIVASLSGDQSNALVFNGTNGNQLLSVPVATGGLFVAGNGVFGSPLHLQSGPAAGTGAANLTGDQLAPVISEAIQVFANAGVDTLLIDQLMNLDVQVADLGGSTLGLAFANAVKIDRDAAGYDWSLDGSVGSDEVDLLSVLVHEFGHVLGLEHDAGFMDDLIDLGERRLPTAQELNALFSGGNLDELP